jgi:hypothetical protein
MHTSYKIMTAAAPEVPQQLSSVQFSTWSTSTQILGAHCVLERSLRSVRAQSTQAAVFKLRTVTPSNFGHACLK